MANFNCKVDATRALMSIPLIWLKRANKDNVILLRRLRKRQERTGASSLSLFFFYTVIIFNDLLKNVKKKNHPTY